MDVLGSGAYIATIDSILTNPAFGFPTGLAVSFSPPEPYFVEILRDAFRDFQIDPSQPYSITISTSAVPVPAAVWLFGSGLPGLV